MSSTFLLSCAVANRSRPDLTLQTTPTSSWTEHTVAEGVARGVAYAAPEPEPSGAKVWFFTRKGGVSKPPYDSLNISTLVGDDEAAVAENRSRIQGAMGGRPSAWVRQVAGDGVVRVEGPGLAGEGDALITEGRGYALVVAIADCVPVALVGEGNPGPAIGMVHSGWRGTLAGIGGKAAGELRKTAGGEVRAYIGPGIRGCCYEVSEELAGVFAERFGSGVVSGRYLSLPDAIRIGLEEAGVRHVHDLGLCTGCRTDLFYSHRKEGSKTGRNLAAVALL